MNTKASTGSGHPILRDGMAIPELIDDNAFIRIDEEDVGALLSKNVETFVAVSTAPSLEDAFNQAVKNLGCPPAKINHLLIGFRCGSKQPDMMGLTRVSTSLTELNPEVSIKWGIGEAPSLGEDFKVIMMASV